MKSGFFTKINTLRAGIALLAALLLAMTAVPGSAEAATYTYVTQFLKINVPDDTLVMTQSTSQYDEVWAKAGITNSKATLEEFSDMGVVASFYNPDTMLTVNFIFKKTMETVGKFTFADMSDSEILEYMSEVTQATQEDGLNVSLTIRRDLNSSQPFFRMILDATGTESPCSEVIYGTIINGEMIQFDSFFNGSAEIDDSFAEQVVRGIEFTRILTPAEYEEEVSKAKVKLGFILGGIVLVIAGLIFLAVFTRKRREKRTKAISKAMTDFRNRMREGLIDTAAEPHYVFSTEYDKTLMEEYGVFSAWFNPEPGFAVAVTIFAIITIYMFMSGHLIYALLLAVLVIVMLYMHYSQSEKAKEALALRYSVKEKPTAVFKFYDEYFTVSGLSTTGEYIYGQVTAVKSFARNVYIFVGDSQALIIRREDLGGVSFRDLRALIRKKN